MTKEDRDTRERLLAAAIQEFALHGYEQGTVRRICAKAGANLNAIKYYFDDKRGLYVEAVKAAHREKRRPFAEANMLTPPTEGDPREWLYRFVFSMVSLSMEAHDRADPHHMLLMREIANPTEALEGIVREFIEPHFNMLNAILEPLLPPDTPSLKRKMFGFSVIGQCIYYKMAAPIIPMLLTEEEREQLDAEQIARHITDVVLTSLDALHRPEA
ncbi:MAG: CerR family C-terminal domain-containing protein [Pirellulaceae bacterium]